MCKILKLNRSSYYKWLNRGETEKDREDQKICQLILGLHEKHNGILGYRRMTLWINRLNQTNYNKKRIRRLMRLLGIASRIRRKRKGYKKSTPQVTAENILNRKFTADNPNDVWLTDVTEFKVIGSSTHNPLVFQTFDEAIAANPGAKP